MIPNLDAEGNYYATLGAGPGTGHVRLQDASGVNCSDYNVTNAVSFLTDRTAPGEFELLNYRPAAEDSIIDALFQLDDSYFDDLVVLRSAGIVRPHIQLEFLHQWVAARGIRDASYDAFDDESICWLEQASLRIRVCIPLIIVGRRLWKANEFRAFRRSIA